MIGILAQELPGGAPPINWPVLVGTTLAIFLCTGATVWFAWPPLRGMLLNREAKYDNILRGKLLLNVSPRLMSVLSFAAVVVLALLGYAITGSWLGGVGGAIVAMLLPGALLKYLRQRRLRKLEDQLVAGVQTLASGVRAGLNLVQAMAMIARDGPVPIRQEFAHLIREYEYGVPVDEAMDNAAERIGSSDYRLVFSALQTHRERGGDLGETLDRIADSIREIQRLEKRVETLTAQGRATARWLGMMPLVVIIILYFLVDKKGVQTLFNDDFGKLILVGVVMMNVLGFLWIKKIVSIDI